MPSEQWGWEYTPPAPLAPSPEAEQAPVWQEPVPPDLNELEQRLERGRRRLPFRVLLTVIAAGGTASMVSALAGAFAVVLGGMLSYVLPVTLPSHQIKAATRHAAADRDARYEQFQRVRRLWRDRVEAHDRQQRAERYESLLWHPVRLPQGPSRVDVFGGTSDGWASLLATWGASVIQSGSRLVVFDLTEQDVVGGLESLFHSRGRTARLDLPAGAGRFNVLGGLDADEAADLLAQAVHTLRPTEGQGDLRTIHADLLETAIRELGGILTFQRVTAALDVLRRTYDAATDGPLSLDELTRLTAGVDRIGQGERVQNELHFLISTLSLLARDEDTAPPPPSPPKGTNSLLWPPTCLAVISTAHRRHRCKDFLDRVVLQRLLHDLRSQPVTGHDSILVIAGCDHLGLEGLEALARHCRRAEIRLILLMERLRGELRELLGSSDSAAVLMRLGNAQDATAAAEFIGRGHRLVLSQLTAQIGKSFTTGTGHSEGTNDSTGWNTGTATSRSGKDCSHSTNRSLTESRAQSWQETVNHSSSDSTGHSATQARVYEFTVEPTTLQALPTTAFVMVDSSAPGRRVTLGDCNPGIVLLNRVARPHRTG
ncbi:hypothetical protein [Streptomyces clavuligerus]|uniref:hypothetical protein n=1 Tax=Streptomyces clavuligerus TaxID=1901 RepID=UPI0002FDC323|nr:hypothetical protein [Streptomyces clavuligerus]